MGLGVLWETGLEEGHEGRALVMKPMGRSLEHSPTVSSWCLQSPCMSHSKAHNLWAIDMAHRTPQSHIAGPCGLLQMVPARAVPRRTRHLEDGLARVQVRRVWMQPLRDQM